MDNMRVQLELKWFKLEFLVNSSKHETKPEGVLKKEEIFSLAEQIDIFKKNISTQGNRYEA